MFLFLAVQIAQAQGTPVLKTLVDCDPAATATSGTKPCTLCNLFQAINNIVTDVLIIIPFIAMVIIAVSGFRVLVNPENSEIKNKVKTIITATIVGLVLIYAAWAIVNMLMLSLGYTHEWAKLPC